MQCFELPDVVDPSIIYADKSHSVNVSDVKIHIQTTNHQPIPSKKVLQTMLTQPATMWKPFLEKLEKGEFDLDQLIIGLKPKERELKVEGRFFSLMSWELREYFVMTEYLIKTFFVPLFKGLTMADDLTEVTKKMMESVNGQGLDDYSNICIANHIDYEKWNNHQRIESNGPVFEVMGKFLGFPKLIYRTHEIFQKSLIYFNDRPDLMIVKNGVIQNSGEQMVCWNGQDGGLEGLRQKGWSILTLLSIRRNSKIRNTQVKILAQGDNQVICTQYGTPPCRTKGELQDAIHGLVKNNQAILESIEEGTRKLGLIINQDETVQAADFLTYGKIPIIRGNIRGLDSKRWSRITCTTNDQLPTFANVMSSVSTNALTVAHFSPSPIDPIRNYLYFGLLSIYILNEHSICFGQRIAETPSLEEADIHNPSFLTAALYLDPSLGGVSGTSLTRFMIRSFPDPVTESLSFWKAIYHHTSSDWLKEFCLRAGNPPLGKSNNIPLTRLIEDPLSLNIPQSLSAMTIMKEEVKKQLYLTVNNIQNQVIKEAVLYSKTEEERMTAFLTSIKPLFPRFLSEFKSATYLGITDGLVSLFQNSRTIRNVFSRKYKAELDSKIIKGEMNSIRTLIKYTKTQRGQKIWSCSASHADLLRRLSWGETVVGTTVPHPFEMLKASLCNPQCLRCRQDGSGYVHVSVPIGIKDYLYHKGPFMAYLGSKTSETTSLIQPWEKETKVPLIRRAAKLRSAISWFVKPNSKLAKSILDNLESLTGEDWSSSIPDFKRTGSALHRFACSRVSSGGYCAQSPAKLSLMVSTTDTLEIGDENYDFMFQSLLIYSQITTGEIHEGKKMSGIYHYHINCPTCLRKISEPTLESDFVCKFEKKDNVIKNWKVGNESWGLTKKIPQMVRGNWKETADHLKSFHIGRAIGFLFGDLTCTCNAHNNDSSIFPLSIRSFLAPKPFLKGVMDGIIRAASLDLLHKQSVRELRSPRWAMDGTIVFLLGHLSNSAGYRNILRSPQMQTELASIPHRVPPSYPLSDKDMGSLIRTYHFKLLGCMYVPGFYETEDKRLFVFADLMSSRVVGPFMLSSKTISIMFCRTWDKQHRKKLREISTLMPGLRDDSLPFPIIKGLTTLCFSINCELRHAVKGMT